MNSWHFYIDDHGAAARHVADVIRQTEPGSGFNYCPGLAQGTAPLINSEYGGIGAGSGDRDVSWAFRDLTTLLRRQPKIQGYVYTELSDIEWEHNGFVNYDRSPKDFGYQEWLRGMTPRYLNGADFIGYDGPPCLVVRPGERVTVPVFVSHFAEGEGTPEMGWRVWGYGDDGRIVAAVQAKRRPARLIPYGVKVQEPITFTAPGRPFVGSVNLAFHPDAGRPASALNYVNLVVRPESPLPRAERSGEKEAVLRFAPGDFARRHWSGGTASPSGKAYGRGKGAFEYRIKLPPALAKAKPVALSLRAELAAKAGREKVDWPSRRNPQDYPQTDGRKWPSTLAVSVNGLEVARRTLPDDPADARGVLSHLKRLDPGSYGYAVEIRADLPEPARRAIESGEPLVLRLAVPDDAKDAGGLCVFGAETGMYPFDPTLTVTTADPLPSDLGVKPGDPVAVDRLADRRTDLLRAGDAEAPTVWAYTITDPGRGWAEPGFDDSSWARGKAGFGTGGTPSVRVNTRWDSPRVWLRTTFELPKLGPDDALTVRLFHDEDAEVFVNGTRLVRTRGYLTDYREFALDESQKALFHPGKNTVAVFCRQTGGGQGIDVGLTMLKGE